MVRSQHGFIQRLSFSYAARSSVLCTLLFCLNFSEVSATVCLSSTNTGTYSNPICLNYLVCTEQNIRSNQTRQAIFASFKSPKCTATTQQISSIYLTAMQLSLQQHSFCFGYSIIHFDYILRNVCQLTKWATLKRIAWNACMCMQLEIQIVFTRQSFHRIMCIARQLYIWHS